MSERILILGGTKEAAALAKQLVDQGHHPVTSLAGRTRDPKPLAGDVRFGGFGGAEKMADWLVENNIEKVIDATHPFATQISANAKLACELASIELETNNRPPWQKTSADIWINCATLEEAVSAIPQNARVFLALGSQHLDDFVHQRSVHFVIRMIDPPAEPLPFKRYDLITGHPASDWEQEKKLLLEHQITHIVCRNSGGSGAYAKIEAARALKIPVIMIEMPA